MIKSNKFIVKLNGFEKIMAHRFILLYVPVVLLLLLAVCMAYFYTQYNMSSFMLIIVVILMLSSLFLTYISILIPDEMIQWISQYRQVAKFYKDKTIPEDIKLTVNLCYCFNDKKNKDYLTGHGFHNYTKENLQYAISILSYVKKNPEVAEWMRKDINECLKQTDIGEDYSKGLRKYYHNNIPRTLSSLLPLAINIANTPDVFAHPEAYQTIIYGLYTAGNSMEDAIENYSTYLDKMGDSRAKITLAAWQNQDFSKIRSISK